MFFDNKLNDITVSSYVFEYFHLCSQSNDGQIFQQQQKKKKGDQTKSEKRSLFCNTVTIPDFSLMRQMSLLY